MLLWRTMSRLHRRFTEAALVALLEGAGLGAARAWPVLDGCGVLAVAARAEPGAEGSRLGREPGAAGG